MSKYPISLACAFLLAACAANHGRADMAYYDLGAAEPSVAPVGPITLDVRLAGWLDNPAMGYRLAFDNPQRLRTYAQARWVASPGQLVAQRLRQRLGVAGLASPCVLRVTIDEFGQTFLAPDASVATLRGEATLQLPGRPAVGRQSLALEVPAITADAAGGARAMTVAVERLADTLRRWLNENDLSGCTKAT